MSLKILIVDDESDILDVCTFYIEEHVQGKNEIIQAKSGNEAIEILKNNNDIDLCVCDHNMPFGLGSDVCEYIYTNKLETKFVLCSSVQPIELPDTYNTAKMFFNILKPDIEFGVVTLGQLLSENFINGAQVELPQVRYLPVSVNLLFMMIHMPCDIYISLTEDKYVKCFNGGEVFSIDDKKKYHAKSLQNLFIKDSGGNSTTLKLLSKELKKIITHNHKRPDEQMMEVHTQVTAILREYGISEDYCAIAKEAIDKSVQEILKSEISCSVLKRMNVLGDYPSKLYLMQSILCGILTKKFTWCTEATLNKLVTACFYQDVSLDSIKLMQIYDYAHYQSLEDCLSEKEKHSFLTHPIRAKEFIAKIKNIPLDVDRIILTQHEMPTGAGFPRNLNSKNISPLSALFILSGIFSKRLLESSAFEDLSEFINDLESRSYDSGNFKEVFASLKVLILNESPRGES